MASSEKSLFGGHPYSLRIMSCLECLELFL